MNGFEIAELFIKAAIVDRRLPDTARPAKLKAQAVSYVHSFEDQKGWFPEPNKRVKRAIGDQLEYGDPGRYAEERQAYWDPDHHRLLPEDITDWETCNDLIKLVSSEGNRRALWHWAISKAGGKSFVKWCRSEGIHEETGRRRKDRAILTIEASFVRNTLQNNENHPLTMLPTGPVEEHISNTIAADLPKTNKRAWMADGAFSSPILADGEYTFEWAEKRNEQRRQRRAAMLKRQAA